MSKVKSIGMESLKKKLIMKGSLKVYEKMGVEEKSNN